MVVANTVGDFYSRGFQITSMQIDGGAPLALGAYTYSPQQDMAFYDRVEVMRGASGLLGAWAIRAAHHLVRKKPLAQRQFKAALSAGSWSRRGVELDASAPLADDGRVRGRAVLSTTRPTPTWTCAAAKSPRSNGVLEADLTPDTLSDRGRQLRKDP